MHTAASSNPKNNHSLITVAWVVTALISALPDIIF
jgi:hypothetical protein